MRIVLFFDLPSTTKSELKTYRKFVKILRENGFMMYQESVYTKLCLNSNVSDSTINLLKANLPKDGFVSCLVLSEKQFSSIINLIGEFKTDVITNDEGIVVL